MRIRNAVRSGYRGKGGHHLQYGGQNGGRSETLIYNKCGEPGHPTRMCQAPHYLDLTVFAAANLLRSTKLTTFPTISYVLSWRATFLCTEVHF
jgi:hypothetical protein